MTFSNLFSCSNKVAVIAGGAGLVGGKIASGLFDFDATVYIADRNKERAEAVIKGTKIKYVYLDITREDSIDKMIANVTENSGKIDILVNSGYPRTNDWNSKCEDVTLDSWKKNVNDNLGGCFFCSQKVAEQMKQHGKGGAIINIGSIYGSVAPDFSIYEGTSMTMPVAYSAIKGGVLTFTKYLATYYAKYNIRVNSVSPGGIFDNQPEVFVEKYIKKTPLRRMANPDDIVGAVIYLASDASSYVTGHDLMVDGGWSVW